MLDAEDSSVWNDLGIQYASVARHSDAQEAFKKSIAVRPGSVSTLHNLGRSLIEADEFDGATKVLKEALSLDTSNEMTAKLLDGCKERSSTSLTLKKIMSNA